MVNESRVGLVVDNDLKADFQRRIKDIADMRKVTEALWFKTISMSDHELISIISDYETEKIDAEMDRLKKKKQIMLRRAAQAKLHDAGKAAIAFAKGRDYINHQFADHIPIINCAFAIKKEELDNGTIQESDFKNFCTKYTAFLSDESIAPKNYSNEAAIEGLKKLGFSNNDILTLLLPE